MHKLNNTLKEKKLIFLLMKKKNIPIQLFQTYSKTLRQQKEIKSSKAGNKKKNGHYMEIFGAKGKPY